MDQSYLQFSSWTRTAACTVLFALCTFCPSALGWALTGYSGHFEQQWKWRDSCVLSLTFCVCPRVMQLLVFCGRHPINTAADWWSLQQLSAAPWHILYTQIQMFTNTCSVWRTSELLQHISPDVLVTIIFIFSMMGWNPSRQFPA